MAKPILVANWKNNPGSLAQARALLVAYGKKALLYKKLSLFIAPPYSYLESVSEKAKRFSHLASQDIFFTSDGGAHTGSITPEILKSFGVRVAIVGHSERRALGETNEVVAQKLKIAIVSGMTPLLCVGETKRDEDGNHLEVLREQLKSSLEGVRRKEDTQKLIIAYEPAWAIGKRAEAAMNPAELTQIVLFIKKALSDIFGRPAAETIPVLYGGSVAPANAAALMKETGIRGLLVGRASLDGKLFAEIAQALITK